jgi:hypothetical protein
MPRNRLKAESTNQSCLATIRDRLTRIEAVCSLACRYNCLVMFKDFIHVAIGVSVTTFTAEEE